MATIPQASHYAKFPSPERRARILQEAGDLHDLFASTEAPEQRVCPVLSCFGGHDTQERERERERQLGRRSAKRSGSQDRAGGCGRPTKMAGSGSVVGRSWRSGGSQMLQRPRPPAFVFFERGAPRSRGRL
eukprot:3894550-Pyramimonas_sp.AAC.1